VADQQGFRYLGTELAVMGAAKNWKRYLNQQIKPFVRGSVLEVGGGIGHNLEYFVNELVQRWTALEPDSSFAAQYRGRYNSAPLDIPVTIQARVLSDLDCEQYDTLIYADVLEHIEQDQAEVRLAMAALKPGGHLVIVVPAHAYLFSEMDSKIGHHRRYNLPSLRALKPANAEEVRARYLDCVGIMASLANRLFLRQGTPTSRQIKLWDRLMVPLSRLLDPLFGFALGKSALIVWKRV